MLSWLEHSYTCDKCFVLLISFHSLGKQASVIFHELIVTVYRSHHCKLLRFFSEKKFWCQFQKSFRMLALKGQRKLMCTQNLRNITMTCHKTECQVRNLSGILIGSCNVLVTVTTLLFCGRVGCLMV